MPSLVPFTRLETVWAAPWMVSSISQIGLRHYRNGLPSDDAMRIAVINGCLCLAVADGVSDAEFGGEGASSVLAVIFRHLAVSLNPEVPTSSAIAEAIEQGVHTLTQLALEKNVSIREYSTTLSLVVIGTTNLVAASIGDSSCLALTLSLRHGQESLVATPLVVGRQSAVSNKPYNITHPDWRSKIAIIEKPVELLQGVLLATDGAEPFFLNQGGDFARSTFNQTVVEAIPRGIEALGPRYFVNFLAGHIKQNEANNGDDRSLILAFKPPEGSIPDFASHA